MAKKENFEELANSVIDLIGGKENIVYFTHCVTRLRFNVKDKGLVKDKEIDSIPGVVGSQWSGDQFQVIIGQDVNRAYTLIQKTYNLEEPTNEPEKARTKKKFKDYFTEVIEAIVACVIPLLSVLIGAGMLKVIMLLSTMSGLIGTESSTYQFLTFVSDAAFYFLPVFVGATAAKKFGTNIGLSMLIGAMLIHPSFIESVNAGTSLGLFGLPVFPATYSSTILPVIMAVYVMSFVERFAERISPNIIKSLVVPLLTLLVMVPLTFVVIGPAGQMLSQLMTNLIGWSYNTIGGVTVGLLAAIVPLLIMTGMHTALIPYTITMMATLGYEPLVFAAMYISNVNQGIASLAVSIKSKDQNLKSVASTSGVTAVLAGVTEPAMYGVNLKYKKPMLGAMIGSFCGGLYAGITHVYAYVLSGSGIFTALSFVSSNSMNLINIIIALVISSIVTFVFTYLTYKDE
ncbi:PTS transporter subunit EIIC [Enterococcus faecalis]|uniref:PTS transporter subunit EIIC n=1 Tax=Enterococcus faecalis TaxID=1351 RepID=UPI0035EF85CC